MASQERAPLRTTSRNLLVAAVVVLIGIGAAAAFGLGFSGALEDSLANPSSAPAQRIAGLERLRDMLGYDGFLKSYRDPTRSLETTNFSVEANKAFTRFRDAGEDERDAGDAQAIGSLVAVFDRAARPPASGAVAPTLGELEQSYGALKLRIASAIDNARLRRMQTLSHAFALSQSLAVLALSALCITLFGIAWFLRTRLLEPLRTLRQSAEHAADGGLYRHLWGIERKDEIGALARAMNRLRRQTASNLADAPESPASDMRAVIESRPYKASEEVLPMPVKPRGVEATVIARRLEADVGSILSAVNDARSRIEDASREAARASQTAIEAANLARAGAKEFTQSAERTIQTAGAQAQTVLAALAHAVGRLGSAAAKLEANPQVSAASDTLRAIAPVQRPMLTRLPFERDDQDAEKERTERDLYAALARLSEQKDKDEGTRSANGASPPLSGLSADLDAIEALTRKNGGIPPADAQALTANLIEAIDRLNGVVERVAAVAERKTLRQQL